MKLTPNEYVERMKALKIALAKLNKIDPATPVVADIRNILKSRVEKIYAEGKQKFFNDQAI